MNNELIGVIEDSSLNITVQITESGAKGKDGYTPVKGIDYFDGAKGDPGKDGLQGKDGTPGKDGVSVTHSWTGTTLNIISASGTSSADLKGSKGDPGEQGLPGNPGERGEPGLPGKDGEPGTPGKDGHTPVKGVDYFTEADKGEIVTSVLAAIPVVGSEGY